METTYGLVRLFFFCFFFVNISHRKKQRRFGGSLNALNARWEMKTDTACEVSLRFVLMSQEGDGSMDLTGHTFKHLDMVAVQYQTRFGLLLYLSSNTLRLPCCHGNHALRCHFSLILARVVLTVGQLYVGQKRSTRKMVADTALVDGSALKKTHTHTMLIIYSCNNEYCQSPFEICR